ncbi:MAG: sigma-70 family RNA polymerase sigma factor [Gaiellaceae bacterium]
MSTALLTGTETRDRAFERLYRRHVHEVYRYVLAVLRNQADAEDATQATFLSAFRAFRRGEEPQKPRNWLLKIAHNECRQRFRASARRPREVEWDERTPAPSLDETVPTADEIRFALAHLSFNQRSALVMRELEGRTYQEIAEILGLSVSAVETLIFRARRALREQLEEGITCHDAELAISKQLDGRLSRKEKGALRAHLRECEDCAGFARSQRAQRGALKALMAIPLPQSLAGLFGGGGAAVGGGVAVKAAAIAAGAALATGVGYEGVKQGIDRSGGATAAPAAAKKQSNRVDTGATKAAALLSLAGTQEAMHDQKPFRKAAVNARRAAEKRHGKPGVVGKPAAKPAKHVRPLSPSHERGSSAQPKPVHPVHPTTPSQGRNHGQNAGGKGKGTGDKKTPPSNEGKPKGGGKGTGSADVPDETAGQGKSGR